MIADIMINLRLDCLGLERGPSAQRLELARAEQQVWHIIPYMIYYILKYQYIGISR